MGLEMIDVGLLSIVPPLVAIILALLTKEVFSSLFVGVFSGMLIYCYFAEISLLLSLQYVIEMMANKLAENAVMIVPLIHRLHSLYPHRRIHNYQPNDLKPI